MYLAPIILFTYNRPEHSKRTLDALAQNPEAKDSLLFIYCDGAKPNATQEQLDRIREVRIIANNENRFKQIKIIEQPTNKGLAKSVTEGVTEVVNEHEKIIVLEDDILVAKDFLSFMNEALIVYKDSEEVVCVSGYTYPVQKKLPETFFINVAECWGWATWKRGWSALDMDGLKMLNQITEMNLSYRFDFENGYSFTQMLQDQTEEKNNSWAILWYASAFLKNKYCLYPGTSLVQNIGNDGSGTHSMYSKDWEVKLATKKIKVKEIEIVENKVARKLISNYFKSLTERKFSVLSRIKYRVKWIFKKRNSSSK